jgi:hypothetical protein
VAVSSSGACDVAENEISKVKQYVLEAESEETTAGAQDAVKSSTILPRLGGIQKNSRGNSDGAEKQR